MLASHTVDHPAELLVFLFARYPEVKRTKVRQWLKHGAIQVNGQSVTRSNHPLQTGDTVVILPKREVRAEHLLPPGMKLTDHSTSSIHSAENKRRAPRITLNHCSPLGSSVTTEG